MAWHYFIDTEGRLWHEGIEFDDPGLLRFFMQNMERLPDGRTRVVCQGEECYFRCEDAPYVVQQIRVHRAKIDLIFPGDCEEPLDPTTLFVGAKNVLYCKVRSGLFVARFTRKAYLDLARQIRQDPKTKKYQLLIDKKKYPIQGAP